MILWKWTSLEKQYVMPEKTYLFIIELFGDNIFFCAEVSHFQHHTLSAWRILKVGLSPAKNNCFICFNESALKMMKNVFYFENDEKCFLFHLKRSFHSKGIQIFVLIFWPCGKNVLIRKIRLISNLWRHSLIKKQLQYTYCPMSHEVKATRQWNLVR